MFDEASVAVVTGAGPGMGRAIAAGFAFENEQAARVVLVQLLAQGTSVEDEVREAMANGGIYVVAPADEARELTQETAVGRAGEAPAGADCYRLLIGRVPYPPTYSRTLTTPCGAQ